MKKNKPKIDYNLCIHCGTCAAVCPQQAIKFEDNKPKINYDLCANCGTCADNCPVKAIKICKI
ncbi:MAG: 4Fe-4S binding protein [bacterium]